MDPEPRRAAWAGWTAPAAVRGLLPAGALTTPAEALQALLNTAIRRLTGRRVTVPGTGGLALRVEALEMHPDPLGVALGQFDDVPDPTTIRSARRGHATVAFTLDTYTEDVPELHHDAADMVTNLFFDDPVDET